MGVKYCHKCGAQVNIDAKFCNACGAALISAKSEARLASINAVNNAEPALVEKEKTIVIEKANEAEITEKKSVFEVAEPEEAKTKTSPTNSKVPKSKSTKKLVVTLVIIAIVSIVGLVGFMYANGMFDPNYKTYKQAKSYLKAGNYDEAILLFDTISDFKNSSILSEEAYKTLETVILNQALNDTKEFSANGVSDVLVIREYNSEDKGLATVIYTAITNGYKNQISVWYTYDYEDSIILTPYGNLNNNKTPLVELDRVTTDSFCDSIGVKERYTIWGKEFVSEVETYDPDYRQLTYYVYGIFNDATGVGVANRIYMIRMDCKYNSNTLSWDCVDYDFGPGELALENVQGPINIRMDPFKDSGKVGVVNKGDYFYATYIAHEDGYTWYGYECYEFVADGGGWWRIDSIRPCW